VIGVGRRVNNMNMMKNSNNEYLFETKQMLRCSMQNKIVDLLKSATRKK
jgi:hypothetical protein